MKLLRKSIRVNPRDPFGQGLDAVITLVVFFGAGFFVDRWLGTTPWAMIVFTLVAAVGVFYRLKNGYDGKMAEYDAEHAARRERSRIAADSATDATHHDGATHNDGASRP